MRAVVLDNEAVQSLLDPRHRKHRLVLAHLEAVATRRRKGADVTALVPTSVRVEAGWDRTAPAAAPVNRLGIKDVALDTRHADAAAAIARAYPDVGVVDAHLGAAVQAHEATEIVVLTSDPGDLHRVVDPLDVTIVRV